MLVRTKEQSITRVSQCSLNCANDGYCAINPDTSASPNLADGKLREMCICPEGYTGLTCLHHVEKMERCRSHNGQHYCLNGGFCRQIMSMSSGSDDNDDNEWRCDCIEADGISAFAGHMCRKPHTEYCNDEGTAYCTNGGTCVNNLVSQMIRLEYPGSDSCACPKEFSGPHCEFLNELVAIHNLTIQAEIDAQFGPTGFGDDHELSPFNASFFTALGFGVLLVLGALATIFVSSKRKYGKLASGDGDKTNTCGVVPCSEIPNAEQFNDDEGHIMHDVVLE